MFSRAEAAAYLVGGPAMVATVAAPTPSWAAIIAAICGAVLAMPTILRTLDQVLRSTTDLVRVLLNRPAPPPANSPANSTDARPDPKV